MEGHCSVCNGWLKVYEAAKTGEAGFNPDNKAVNYRLKNHTRDDVGGDCGGSDLPPDTLE